MSRPFYPQVELKIGELQRDAGAGVTDWLALANRMSLIILQLEEDNARLRGVLDGTHA